MFIGDIIRFKPTVRHLAGRFCVARQITGRIVTANNDGVLEIDAGLPYNVFAVREDLELVAKCDDIPTPDDI